MRRKTRRKKRRRQTRRKTRFRKRKTRGKKFRKTRRRRRRRRSRGGARSLLSTLSDDARVEEKQRHLAALAERATRTKPLPFAQPGEYDHIPPPYPGNPNPYNNQRVATREFTDWISAGMKGAKRKGKAVVGKMAKRAGRAARWAWEKGKSLKPASKTAKEAKEAKERKEKKEAAAAERLRRKYDPHAGRPSSDFWDLPW